LSIHSVEVFPKGPSKFEGEYEIRISYLTNDDNAHKWRLNFINDVSNLREIVELGQQNGLEQSDGSYQVIFKANSFPLQGGELMHNIGVFEVENEGTKQKLRMICVIERKYFTPEESAEADISEIEQLYKTIIPSSSFI